MRAKIILVSGIAVEAEGTAQEIADLAAALGRARQIPEDGSRDVEVSADTAHASAPKTPGIPGNVDLEIEDSSETLGENGEESGLSDLPGERDQETEEDADRPIEVGPAGREPNQPLVAPLDLVVQEVANQFRLIADPTRLQILTTLMGRGHNVGEICESLGGQSQPAVSHHLGILRVSGLVTPSREGKFNFYDLTEQGRTLTQSVLRFGPADGAATCDLFRQASDPMRLQILTILSQGDRNVGELCSDLGGQSQPAVSHHLARMRHSRLIEARREGKFSFYTLLEEGRELARLIGPMMAAKARADAGGSVDTFETEEIDFSLLPDDWMTDPEASGPEPAGEDRTGPGGAPPAHMLCRRVLLMVQELHRRGHERLRIAPGLTPSTMHWVCSIIPVDHVLRDHGAMSMAEGAVAARYTSGQGARFFDWPDAEHDSPVGLAGKFLERFPELEAMGRGSDPEYARWYSEMLRATHPDGLIYAYADWSLPVDHLPALGCTADVRVPLPPTREGTSEARHR